MNEPPKDYDKQFDLEPSEYGPADRQQPFWGFNAKTVAILFVVGFLANAIATRIIAGYWPYWLRSLLG